MSNSHGANQSSGHELTFVRAGKEANALSKAVSSVATSALAGTVGVCPTPQIGTGNQQISSEVLAVGTDLVDIPQFATLLSSPGSDFGEPDRIFTARELRRAHIRAQQKGDGLAIHLAAVWALKEAAIKAWLSALSQAQIPPPLRTEEVVWSQISVRHDATGSPSIELSGIMADAFNTSIAPTSLAGSNSEKPPKVPPHEHWWKASASHDGNYAVAVVILGRQTTTPTP